MVGIGVRDSSGRRPNTPFSSCDLLSPLRTLYLSQDTETESYINNAEPWKQGIGGLVAPRVFAARFFVTRCVRRRGKSVFWCMSHCLLLLFCFVLRTCVVCARSRIATPCRLASVDFDRKMSYLRFGSSESR